MQKNSVFVVHSSELWQIQRVMYLPLQTRQNFHHTQRILLCCPFVVRFTLLHPLAITDLVSVPIVFPFIEYYVNVIIQHTVLGGLFLSFSKMHLNFLQVVGGISSFVLAAEWYPIVWTHCILFIHWPAEGRLGCSQARQVSLELVAFDVAWWVWPFLDSLSRMAEENSDLFLLSQGPWSISK